MLCPVCKKEIPVSGSSLHVNQCLDAVNGEEKGQGQRVLVESRPRVESRTDSSEASGSLGSPPRNSLDGLCSSTDCDVDGWVVLGLPPTINKKKPPRLRTPFGLRNKIRTKIESFKSSPGDRE